VLTSKHECVTAKYVSALDMTKNLAYCKWCMKSCLQHPYKEFTFFMFCKKKSHHRIWDPQCDFKLCVKNRTGRLKSLCVNKLGYLLATKQIELICK
jgi:hypothetical protein